MATQWTAGTVPGQILTAATLNTIGAVWETYIPTWTASVTNPSVGAGFIEGRYCRLQTLVIATGYIIPGVGWSAGSGNYRVALPVTARSMNSSIGYATLLDASAGYIGYFGIATQQSTTNAEFRIGNGANVWSPTVPIPLAQSDQMRFTLIYEAA
jgi:hypothetical protein